MATLTIDTYQFVENLKRSGMAEAQARALAGELQKLTLEHVATKEDIAALKADLQQVKADIFKWAVPLLLGQAALIVALVELLGSAG
jgi:hypothetical protein